MSRKFVVRLSDEQAGIVMAFARKVDLSTEEFCKKAVFYAINDATRRAEELELQQSQGETKHELHESTSSVSEGTLVQDEQHPIGDALSHKEDVTAD